LLPSALSSHSPAGHFAWNSDGDGRRLSELTAAGQSRIFTGFPLNLSYDGRTKCGAKILYYSMCQHETKHCGRCQAPFECKVGNILECQCYGIEMNDPEKAFIAANYSDCLCRACLEAIKFDFLQQNIDKKFNRIRSVGDTR
jgi:Cysteine-rich CWC